jgi:hypothetical protein
LSTSAAPDCKTVAADYVRQTCRDPEGIATKEDLRPRESTAALNSGAHRAPLQKGQYFEGVPPEVWSFPIGGYQVCEEWLKDRRGRTLS